MSRHRYYKVEGIDHTRLKEEVWELLAEHPDFDKWVTSQAAQDLMARGLAGLSKEVYDEFMCVMQTHYFGLFLMDLATGRTNDEETV